MAITFVIGRAGSGKTTRMLEEVVRQAKENPLGRPIWVIVPRQATFQMQRELAARLGSYSRVRVVAFNELGEEVLAEVGGVPVANVTAAGRRMIIGRLLYTHHDRLGYFASSARRPGLATAIDALFDEFERAGRTPAELGDIIELLRPADAAAEPRAKPLADAAGASADPSENEGSNAEEVPTLSAKLADLRLLYGAYTAFLGDARFDPHRRRSEVLGRLDQSPALHGSRVYVDGFFEFAANERAMLVKLCGIAESIEVNLTADPDSQVFGGVAGGAVGDTLSPFFRTERAYVRLVAELAGMPTRIMPMRDLHRWSASALQRIEARFAEASTPKKPAGKQALSGGDAVLFAEAPDRRTEVQAVARRIRDLLRVGYRQRDIVVLTRSLDDYLHLIHAAFDEHGLTWFADRRRPATHHPLVRLIRSAVRIARDGWDLPQVVSLIKSGLTDLTVEEVDRLENYLREHGLAASAWLGEEEWHFAERYVATDEEFAEPDPADMAAAEAEPADVPTPLKPSREPNELRRHLLDRLQPLTLKLHRRAAALPLRQFAAELVGAIDRLGARLTLARWIGDDRPAHIEASDEHQQVWAQFIQLLDEMVDVLGDETVEPGEFVEILESGLDAFDLAITPPSVDEILVGTADRTRVLFPRAVFVLGLNRGVFPAAHRDDSILSGPERRELHSRRIEVEPDSRRRQLDERFLAYFAMTRASDRLVLSRTLADESGRAYDPSEFWIAARQAVPEARVSREEPCTGELADCLSTPRDLISSLLDWARNLLERKVPTDDADAEVLQVDTDGWRWQLYDWLSRGNARGGELGRLLERAWPALCYANTARLSPELAALLFPSPLVASASQLESFASCPFQHFVSYGLRLSQRGDGSITPIEISRVYHDTLRDLLAQLMADKTSLAALPPERLNQLVQNISQSVAEQVHASFSGDDARAQYLVSRMSQTLSFVLGTLREQLERGSLRPARVDVPFGPRGKLKSPDIALPGGGTLQLRGKIDRVDVSPGGEAALYDYRLGERKLVPADVLYGIDLRLLTCLLVLDRAPAGANAKKLRPMAAFTARLRRSIGRVDHPSEAADPQSPEFLLTAKPRGIVVDADVALLDKNLSTGVSQVLAVRVNKDGGIGDRERSDAATADEFDLLIRFVEAKVRELASGIVKGVVGVEPYLYHDVSPCVRCDYRKLCRFETSVNRYRVLQPLKRSDALDAMRKQVGGNETGAADVG
jgi:ATP-dependent helicase/nuclease subunit B